MKKAPENQRLDSENSGGADGTRTSPRVLLRPKLSAHVQGFQKLTFWRRAREYIKARSVVRNVVAGDAFPLLILTLCAAGLLIYLIASVKRAEAAEWLVDHPIRNRTADVTWSQDGTCDQAVLERAGAMIDFYLSTPFRIRPVNSGGRVTATCIPVLHFGAFNVAGRARVYRDGNLITHAELEFNRDRYRFDTALHELLHALGMAHSVAPDALLCAPPATCNLGRTRLAADDLAGLAALYDVPPICTPHWDGEVLYLPYIGGWWAELRAVDPGNLAAGLALTDAGPSEDRGWTCDLWHSPGFQEITTSVYAGGWLVKVRLEREGPVWRLANP